MESQKQQILTAALRLLAATPKTRHQLAEKLSGRGFQESLLEEVLNELEAKGILDDRAFARALTTRLTQEKPAGRRKIEFELKRRGFPAAVRAEALNSLEPGGELERAAELAIVRWTRFHALSEEKRKKKVFDFLLRRGFDFQTVREVMENIASHNNED